MSMTGLRERNRAERLHDEARALETLYLIETAERDLIALVSVWRRTWTEQLDMDRGSLLAIDDLLSDLFAQERADACEALDIGYDDLWDRERAVQELANRMPDPAEGHDFLDLLADIADIAKSGQA